MARLVALLGEARDWYAGEEMPTAKRTERLARAELWGGLDELARRALEEDSACDDVTTRALMDPATGGRGLFVAKAPGVVVGLVVSEAVFRQADEAVRFKARVQDGTQVKRGTVIAEVEGPLASVLGAERVALNFLQRLSGIATLTARYVRAVDGTGAQVLDTRKTTPGLRRLEKYAVRMGGGRNHRMGLSDAVLIKDNHIAALRAQGLTLAGIVRLARSRAPRGMTIEVEVTTVEEAREAASAGAEMVLLDNMEIAAMRQAVRAMKGRCRTEASGGITLRNVRQVAETGVDCISVGALTHSAKALDISLEMGPSATG